MPRKKRSEGTRAPNLASSIYQSDYDGKWHGRVTVGVKDDGSPDRRHIERTTEAQVRDAVRKLEAAREAGTVRKPGRGWRVETWLIHWVENIVKPTVKYKAYRAYRTAVYHHLIPGLGKHWLDKIQPEHFETLYAKIVAGGRKPATAHQVHRTARTAWGEAKKRGYITRNPVELAKPPRVEEEEIDPFEVDEIRRLIDAALGQRNGVRFVLALALGTRQGETIGLKWQRLNKSTKTLRIMRKLERRTWEHGCDDPYVCGAKYHKTKPCRENCKRHQRRPCPPPCPPDCVAHARMCPKRYGGGLVESDVKSRAGRRGIVLPNQLYELLEQHRLAQDTEREHAGTVWEEGDWMFTQPNGRPISPEQDLREWKQLLAAARVREARLHDARHTAATVLLLLGIHPRVVMEIMGWSSVAMTKRYQHVLAVLHQDVARQINTLLWGGSAQG